MSLYAKNLEALKKRGMLIPNFPEIYEKRIFTDTAKNGMPTLRIRTGGRDKYIHSKFDPKSEAEKWAGSLEFKEDSVIIIFGCGLAYHARAALNILGSDNQAFIIEPDAEIAQLMLKTVDISDILEDERLSFVLSGDIQARLFEIIKKEDKKRVATAVLPIYNELFTDKASLFLKAARDVIQFHEINKNTAILRAAIWHRAFFSIVPCIGGSVGWSVL